MKKENRLRAQERRAAERKKQEQKKKTAKVMGYVIPIVIVIAVIALIVICVVDNIQSKKAAEESASVVSETSAVSDASAVSETSAASEVSAASETAEETSLDTTEGLVAEDGDTVNIDYTGYLDGEAFDGGSTNGAGADLTLGSGTYIDGFESGVVGHAVGETFDLNLTFPDDYGNADLAGQEVVFTVTLNGIYK